MREVQRELSGAGTLPAWAGDRLAEVVWAKFHEAKAAGWLRRRVWFVTIDFSDEVAGLLVKWFGPDPTGSHG